MPEANHHNHPGKLADRYRVGARIGEGAHATTWRGHDERLDRPVAIKMLHSRLANDPVFVQRFQAEAKVAASVRQTNVVDVYDFGQQDGTLYIVMQYVDGENLKSLIQRSAPLPVRDIRRIIGNILDGLQAIHTAGIIHRDIKPHNVLVGTDGVARVTDFGIADVQGAAGLTADGLTIGTVDYMAPEQAQGLSLTPSADLYATGVILYEMLTGTLPFQGDSSRETMVQHINGQLTPPSLRLPGHGISPAMDAVIVQSMAKDPARRFGSARAMKQAVGQALMADSGASKAQATSLMPAQMPVTQTPSPVQQFAPSNDDAGAGLSGAFRGLLALLFIGAVGIALWAAVQFMAPDGFDFSLPAIFESQQEQTTPTPVSTEIPNQVPAIEPGSNVQPSGADEQVPAQPDVVESTQEPQAPEETALPPDETAPPIEQIEPDVPGDVPTEEPIIDPSGYDGGILNV